MLVLPAPAETALMLSKERGVRLEERLLRELESTAAVAAAEAPSDSLQGLSLDRQCRRLCCPSCAVPKVRGQVDFDFVTRSRKLRGWFQSRTSPPSVDSLATLLAAPQDPSRSVSLALKAPAAAGTRSTSSGRFSPRMSSVTAWTFDWSEA